jgi:hypothetical protein
MKTLLPKAEVARVCGEAGWGLVYDVPSMISVTVTSSRIAPVCTSQ